MIAYHPRQKPGEPIKRSRTYAAYESKSCECAEIGEPGLNGDFDDIRFVCFAGADLRLWVVKTAVGGALYRLPDMAIVARRRRGNSRHDVGTVDQAECGVAEQRLIAVEERSAAVTWAAVGVNDGRLNAEC